MSTSTMAPAIPRLTPGVPPFAPDLQAALDRTMRGKPPLLLFTTLLRDERLARKFFAGGLLDRGHLSLRQRELVIHRTTALCRSEYEWGVHVAAFSAHAGIDATQQHALVHGGPDAACWTDDERLLLRLCDALHQHCDVDDALWQALAAHFSEDALLELLMLAGAYRSISCLTNALRLPLESDAARFPPAAAAVGPDGRA